MPDPSPATPPGTAARARYAARLAELESASAAAATESRRLGIARGLVFLVGLAAFLRAAWPGTTNGAAFAIASAAAAVGFVALIRRHELVERRRAEAMLRVGFNREGLARLDRRWPDIPDTTVAPDENHPYAADLGISGPASLMHLIGGWCTPLGRETLGDWLLAPAPVGEILDRQRAVEALAPREELRETLGAHARLLEGATPARFAAFRRWAGEASTTARWRLRAARVITALIGAGVVLHASGAVGWAAWLPPIVAGWVLTALSQRRTHDTFAGAEPGRQLFRGLPPLLSAALTAPDEGALASVRARLEAGPEAAPAAVDRLERLLAAADARHMWLHFVLQSLTLWDFHVLAGLERWRRESGTHAGEWLAALGEAEALAALALLRHEHAEWCFPEIGAPADGDVVATSLTHPLLPQDRAVPNDVRVGPPGTVLVITGSNMSGKSTLLRGVGLNAVLALAGGPVAARAMRMPPLRVATCMRVEDSLAGGVSYFMAELLRLRRVAETVEGATARGEAALYLLDEILQGTNTAERRVAAVHVIERLVRSGAVGVVTTHDLDLADAAELRAAATELHFQEQVDEGGESMSFDYLLRPGRATSVNALRLMRMVGL